MNLGGPGEVHSYFSPYGIPYDASVTYFSVLADLHFRLKKKIRLADSPFRFATGIDKFTGEAAWSLAGMKAVLKTVPLESLKYHNRRGDLARWAETSLGEAALAERFASLEGCSGKTLRRSLIDAVQDALERWR